MTAAKPRHPHPRRRLRRNRAQHRPLGRARRQREAITLLDRSDAFVFGYAKLDLLFGRATAAAVRHPYASFVKPGVTLCREVVTAIDPTARRVTTDAGSHEADILVLALGADYDVSATPGVTLGQNEFYSVAGAAQLGKMLPGFTKGHAVIGVCGAPYKCPLAPSECALMLHDDLDRCTACRADSHDHDA